MKLYTQDQIKRACQQAEEDMYWHYYEGGAPGNGDVTDEVMHNLQLLEELEPITEVHISHDVSCICKECCV